MKYAFLVAWREYAENARTKGFWIGIFLLPAILLLSIQVPVWLEKKGTPIRHFVVADQSGQFEPVIREAFEKAHQKAIVSAVRDYARNWWKPEAAARQGEFLSRLNRENPQAVERFFREGGPDKFIDEIRPHLAANATAFETPRRRFQQVPLPSDLKADADLALLRQELRPYLRGSKKLTVSEGEAELYAALLIPAEVEANAASKPSRRDPAAGTNQVEYWAGNLADMKLKEEFERAINGEIRKRGYEARGISPAVIREVESTSVPVVSLNPKKEEGQEKVAKVDIIRQWAPTGFVYLLWISIFTIAQMLLNNTIEEKSNRIIEVLLSSVTPAELMMGKLAGIAAVGLTMVCSWMLALLGILTWKAGGSEIATQLSAVLRGSNLVPAFVIYFLLGYLLYAGVILSIGSICNSLKEAQNYMGVITLIMMVPLMTMMFIPKDPNGTLATTLSWIPFYTPFVMMNRATADPPMFDLIGTMVMLLVTTALTLWLAGKIFRIGVLRTGQPPRLMELIRWLRN